MGILDQLGITESSDPGAFPSPRQYVQGFAGAQVDMTKVGADYADSWGKLQKSLGTPEWQVDQGKELLKAQVFGAAYDPTDFLTNYDRYVNPAQTPATVAATAPVDPKTGSDGIGAGLLEGAGSSVAAVPKGVFRDLPNAAAARFGDTLVSGAVDPNRGAVQGVVEDALSAGGAMANFLGGVTGLGGTEPTQLPSGQQAQYLTPETVRGMIRFGGEDILYGGNAMVELGKSIAAATKADDPGGFGFRAGRAIGSAVPVLMTGLGAAALKASTSTAVALGTAQSAVSLANEQAEDFARVIAEKRAKAAAKGELAGSVTYNAEDLSNATFAGMSLAVFDALNLGAMLKAAKVTDMKGLDKILGGRVSDALAGPKIQNPVLKGMLVAGAVGAVSEGTTEMIQQIGSNFIASDIVQYDTDRNMFTGVVEAGEGGAVAGAFLNALLGGLIGGRRAGSSDPAAGTVDSLGPTTVTPGSFQSTEQAPLEDDGTSLLRGTKDAAEFRRAALSIVAEARRGAPEAAAREPAISAAAKQNYAQLQAAEQAAAQAAALRATIQERQAAGVPQSALREDAKRLTALNRQAANAPALRQERDALQASAAPVQSALNLSIVNPWSAKMADVEARYGLPSGTASVIASIESGFNPTAKNPNSSASGLYQFIDSTARRYGLLRKGADLRGNAEASIEAFGKLAADNAAGLREAGIPVTPFTIYMTHQQGLGGFRQIVRAAQTGGAMPEQLRERLDLNGGRHMTAGQFLQAWQRKFERKTRSGQQMPDVRALPTVAEEALGRRESSAYWTRDKFFLDKGLPFNPNKPEFDGTTVPRYYDQYAEPQAADPAVNDPTWKRAKQQFAEMDNRPVDYQGVKGVLRRTDTGYEVVSDGQAIPVEGSLSGIAPSVLGVTPWVPPEGWVPTARNTKPASTQAPAEEPGQPTPAAPAVAQPEAPTTTDVGQQVQLRRVWDWAKDDWTDAVPPAASEPAATDVADAPATSVTPVAVEDPNQLKLPDPKLIRVTGRPATKAEVSEAVDAFYADTTGEFDNLSERQVEIMRSVIDFNQTPVEQQQEVPPEIVAAPAPVTPPVAAPTEIVVPELRKKDGTPYTTQPTRDEVVKAMAALDAGKRLSPRYAAIIDAITGPASQKAPPVAVPEGGYTVGDVVQDVATGEQVTVVGKAAKKPAGGGPATTVYKTRKKLTGPATEVAAPALEDTTRFVPQNLVADDETVAVAKATPETPVPKGQPPVTVVRKKQAQPSTVGQRKVDVPTAPAQPQAVAPVEEPTVAEPVADVTTGELTSVPQGVSVTRKRKRTVMPAEAAAVPVEPAQRPTITELLDNASISTDAHAAIIESMGENKAPKTVSALKFKFSNHMKDFGYAKSDIEQEWADVESAGIPRALIPEDAATSKPIGETPARLTDQELDTDPLDTRPLRFALGSQSTIAAPEADVRATLDKVLGKGGYELGLPAAFAAQAPDGTVAKAAFWKETGRIYVDPAQIGSQQEAEFYAMQELGHRGLDRVLGPDYSKVLNEMHQAIGGDAGIQRLARDNGIDMSPYFRLADDQGLSPQARAELLVDEVVSHLAAPGATLTVRAGRAVKRVVGYFRAGLRQAGLARLAAVTDSDVVYLASVALKAGRLQDGPLPSMKGASQVAQELPRYPPRYGLATPQQQQEAESAADLVNDFNTRKRKTAYRAFSESDGVPMRQRYAEAVNALAGDFTKLKEATAHRFARYFTSDGGLDRDLADLKANVAHDAATATYVLGNEVTLQDMLWQQVFGKPAQSLSPEERAVANKVLRGEMELPDPQMQKHATFFRKRVDAASRDLTNALRRTLNRRIQGMDQDGREALADLIDEYDAGTFEWGVDVIPPHLSQALATYARIKTIESNYGSYLRTSYQAFSDPKWAEKIKGTPTFDAAVGITADRIAQRRAERGLPAFSDTELSKEATHSVNMLLDRAAALADPFEFMVDASGGANQDIFRRKDPDLPPEIKAVLGELDDPTLNYANSILKIYGHVSALHFQGELRKVVLATGQASIAGNVDSVNHTRPIGTGARWSELSDLLATPELVADLEAYGDLGYAADGDAFYRKLVMATQAVKYGKTVLSPTTMMRNLLSGLLLAGAVGSSALSPTGWRAMKTIWQAKTRYVPGIGYVAGTAEAAAQNELYLRLGIRKDGAQSGELAAMLNDVVGSTDTVNRKGGLVQHFLSLAQRGYEFGDDFYKVVAFETDKRDIMAYGVSETEANIEAARRVRDTMPTYSRVPHAVQQLRKFPVMGTFVSFPWEIVRNTVNNVKLIQRDLKGLDATGRRSVTGPRPRMAMRRAMGLVVGAAIPSALVYFFNSLMGVDDEMEDVVDATGPSWQKGSLKLFTENTPEGFSFVDMSAYVPSEVYAKAVRHAAAGFLDDDKAITEGLFNAASSIAAPFASVDITVSAAFDVLRNATPEGYPVYGKGVTLTDILYDKDGVYEQNRKEALVYLGQKVGPGFVSNYFEAIRANSDEITEAAFAEGGIDEGFSAAIGGTTSPSGRVYSNNTVLAGLLGVRVAEKSLDQVAFAASKRSFNSASAVSGAFGELMDDPTPRSPEWVSAQIENMEGQRKRAYMPAYRMIRYYQENLGYPPGKILQLMSAGKGESALPEAAIRSLMAGVVPKYSPDLPALMDRSTRAIDSRGDLDALTRLQAKRNIIDKARFIHQSVAQSPLQRME